MDNPLKWHVLTLSRRQMEFRSENIGIQRVDFIFLLEFYKLKIMKPKERSLYQLFYRIFHCSNQIVNKMKMIYVIELEEFQNVSCSRLNWKDYPNPI